MKLEEHERNIRIVTIKPTGRVDAFNAPELRTKMDELIDGGVRHLVVDLIEVDFLDSAGMAVLVSGLKRTRQAGGDIKLVWPANPEARRIFLLTKFDKVFDFADNAAGAEDLF